MSDKRGKLLPILPQSCCGFYPLWMISNLTPLDWTTRLKPLWLRLMLSLNCSLNSGLLVFFTVLVLSLWASSYTHINECIKTHLDREVSIIYRLSVKDSYRAGKRKFKLHTRIQIVSWDTWRQRGRWEWTYIWHITAWLFQTCRPAFSTWGSW